ncbi:hypothetical protein [Bacillus pseudomycoides]|uniref:hypothetical protein n=1 Tax=Bacillus pseudomycoides TaxID=64104 RepID=UPI000BEF3656|nr:hypothetical protein [Bacillus pseudomycoides]PEN09697.1 hypothetical protein CN640_11655 [Bacillus pseudomycoides]
MAKFTKEQIERAAINGVSISMLYQRTRKGMDVEMAITTPKVSKSEAGRRGAANQTPFTVKKPEKGVYYV